MAIKQKKWYWWLTILANPNMSTTLYPHIYVSKNFYNLSKQNQDRIIKHEKIHLQQQKENGLFKFLFLYCFCFPFFWNKWRFMWEYNAYVNSGTDPEYAKKLLRSWKYGWIILK
ncbi:hypothetical protein COV16_00070 [Candidatus Woesearchaeota archaeon CG10_big_fil_rev_8_21_14_0_10_34_8]|nr:MAG: hypothetical protein COV16_00070 [Candidatus Woesearchaeota archaeon CG10_big_fil_rev_8_21_14_0_10_34_8]